MQRVEIKKASGATEMLPIQAVYFSKDRFKSAEEAARWLDANGLSARAGAHHYPDSWGFDQEKMERFDSTSLRAVNGGEGVRIVVGDLAGADPLTPVMPDEARRAIDGAVLAQLDEEDTTLAEDLISGEVPLADPAPNPVPTPPPAPGVVPAYSIGDRVEFPYRDDSGVIRGVSVEPCYLLELDSDPTRRTWVGERDIRPEAEPALDAVELDLIEKQGGGLMIALCLELADASGIAVAGGVTPDDLHCTLAYCGKLANLPSDATQRVSDALDAVVAEFGPVIGVIGGVGVFNASSTSDGMDVVHASLDSPVLPALREAIVRAIEGTGIPVKKEHGFDPHITLAYTGGAAGGDAQTHVIPRLPTKPLVFKNLAIRAGLDGQKIDKPFVGTRIVKMKSPAPVSVAQVGDEGGEARGAPAVAVWGDSWQTLLPPTGSGKFAYQHHWKGLSKEESSLGEADLLKTALPVHADLRFEGRSALWGFAVFLGKTANVRDAEADLIAALPADESLQGTWKATQSTTWLDVGVREPLVSPPGGPGAGPDSFAKFFAEDYGRYDLGVCREQSFEIFFHGIKVRGRYLISFSQVGARREWVISRPEDQTPTSERESLEVLAADTKAKGQRWLWYGGPSVAPRLIDVTKWEPRAAVSKSVEKDFKVPINKMDADRQIVYGVVLEPDYHDSEGDSMSAPEIEKAAHGFMEKWRTIGLKHTDVAPAVPVESWIAPQDFRLGGTLVKKGSWILGVKVKDAGLWAAIRSGRYRAFSVGGFGRRKKVASSKRI